MVCVQKTVHFIPVKGSRPIVWPENGSADRGIMTADI